MYNGRLSVRKTGQDGNIALYRLRCVSSRCKLERILETKGSGELNS